MKTIPIALAANYASGAPAIAHGLKVTRTDGQVFAWTSADRDAIVDGVAYDASQGLDVSSIAASAGLAVDNLELTTLDDGSLFSRQEVHAGVWQNAAFLIIRYDWTNPGAGGEPLLAGTVGAVKLRNGSIVAELRGLQQYLQQAVGNVTSKTCRARFADFPAPAGSNRCRLDVADWTDALVVSAVTDRRSFVADPAVGTPGDPNFATVVSLLHLNGANTSTTITDTASTPLTWAVVGNAQISTTQSRFGGASLLLDGTGDWIETSNVAGFQWGTGDFTAECWVRTTDNNFCLFDAYQTTLANCWQLFVNSSGYLLWYSSNGTSAQLVLTGGTTAVNDGSWHHVAASRASGTLRLFVDGALVGSAADTRNYTAPSKVAVGAQVTTRNATYDLAGHVDEARWDKGFARYTSAFTAPAAAFYDSAPTGGTPRAADWFAEGVVTFTSGANAGMRARVKAYGASSDFELLVAMPHDLEVGDTLQAVAGCRKRLQEDCRDRFDNVINFQGEPHLPGVDALTAAPEVSA